MSDFIDEELLKDWFEEAYSQVEAIESNLLVLESDTSNAEAIDAIFRAAHTLKGGSATVQMEEISRFTHTLEDSMDEVRKGEVKVDSSIIDILLSALDIIKGMISARSEGNVFSGNIDRTINELKKIAAHTVGGEKKEAASAVTEPQIAEGTQEEAAAGLGEYDLMEIKQANTENLPLYKLTVTFDEANPMRTVGGIQVFTLLRDIGNVVKTYPDFDDLYSEDFHKEVVYIVASSEPSDKILKFSIIPDTTVSQKIEPLNIKDGAFFLKKQASAVPAAEKKDPAEEKISSLTENKVKTVKQVSEEIKEGQKEFRKEAPAPVKEAVKNVASSVLRVDSSRIDDLLNLVSEIVINKATFNQISMRYYENFEKFNFILNVCKDKTKKFADSLVHKGGAVSIEDGTMSKFKKDFLKEFGAVISQFDAFTMEYKDVIEKFKSTTQNLDRISSDLREGVMRVRMIQIKQVFSRFPRLVRDLSRDLHKDVELVMEGEETEVDKAMLDDLIDPLIHIVRNAVDHGLESPEERLAAGKKNPGMLKLKAVNEGSLISIYITDNGKGIDAEAVRKRAIERNLISADKNLKEQEIYGLLFEPGFSTAEKITSVSGRGVGLDVVKKNIEKLSGSVRISSSYGKGTTFSIKLPLTLAIIQGLMVKVQGEIYALPISSVIESIRIKLEDIMSIDNYEVINVRNEVLSLMRLNRLFNLGEEKERDYYFVVIVGVNDKKMGLLVDSLIGEEDIVIKPLKDKYTNTPGIAGATVLGDGTVSLILDVSQIVELGLKQELENQQNRSLNQGSKK